MVKMTSATLPQSELLKCIIGRIMDNKMSHSEAMTNIEFMTKNDSEKQWKLCRQRISETREQIVKVIDKENWPCFFPEGNQMFFLKYKKDFGCNRISIVIGPDTYATVFMETALLQPGTRDFVDKYGYTNQDTKMFGNIDNLLQEMRRIIEIYKTF
jgi:hypothetical protein